VNMTRGQFLQYCTTSAAALGLSQTHHPKVKQGIDKMRMVFRIDHCYSLQALPAANPNVTPTLWVNECCLCCNLIVHLARQPSDFLIFDLGRGDDVSVEEKKPLRYVAFGPIHLYTCLYAINVPSLEIDFVRSITC